MDQNTKNFIGSVLAAPPNHLEPAMAVRINALMELSGSEARIKFDEIITECVLVRSASDYAVSHMVRGVRDKNLWT